MSSSLSWEPPPEETKKHYIDLKYEIGKYFDSDYNGGSESWEADKSLIPFLQGIASVGEPHQKRDARELIDAIENYGKVILTIS